MTNKAAAVQSEALKRAMLPEVLREEDVALALHLTREEAIDMIRRGYFGPVVSLGERYAILRRTFLAALEGKARVLGAGPWA